jgi:2-keto-4-pentenoate hydratase/2-oxohepta-3-ene-1,7-dioic acid hydratase in catechol pathway
MRMKLILAVSCGLLLSIVAYLNRGLGQTIQAADFTCLGEDDGQFSEDHLAFNHIYGIGLAYAKHINETASSFDASIGPPVFQKASVSLTEAGSRVAIPTASDLVQAAEAIEPGIATQLQTQSIALTALLDYEVELAFVLLDDVSAEELKRADFIPKIGFLIANDVSARSVAILGEGQPNRFDYWGASKSFAGFTPNSGRIWVPSQQTQNGIPCVSLQTQVNGSVRQDESTANLIYRPKDMLHFIQQRYPQNSLKKGDLVLTGTPGGVIFNIPRWKVRLAEILGFDRFQKLSIAQRKSSAEAFLKPGNTVRVSGEWLGEASIVLE